MRLYRPGLQATTFPVLACPPPIFSLKDPPMANSANPSTTSSRSFDLHSAAPHCPFPLSHRHALTETIVSAYYFIFPPYILLPPSMPGPLPTYSYVSASITFDKSPQAVWIFAYCNGPGKMASSFEGRTDGTIAPARGPVMFGWDAITG